MSEIVARSIGDKVWIAWGSPRHSVVRECPVCFGREEIHIVMGDDSKVAVVCGGCSRGGAGPTGTDTVFEARVGVCHSEVVSVEKLFGGEMSYRYSLHDYDRIGGVYETEQEAQVAADEALPGLQETAAKTRARVSADKWTSASWSVKYHRSEIRSAKSSIKWHEAQLRALTDRAPEEDETT